jgi:quinol monooxygenase YgiN
MLIVAGTFQVEPARRDEMLRDREASILASRAEPGCITYVMSADPFDPGIVHLFERWESKEALGAHLAAMASDGPPAGVVGVEIQQYEISNIGPLGS